MFKLDKIGFPYRHICEYIIFVEFFFFITSIFYLLKIINCRLLLRGDKYLNAEINRRNYAYIYLHKIL